jgi:phosphoserine phosphatase RsbU/P
MNSPAPMLALENESLRRIRGLTEVSRAFTLAMTLEEVHKHVIDGAVTILGATAAVLLHEDAEGSMRIRALHGGRADLASRYDGRFDESVLERLRRDLAPPPAHFLGVPLVLRGRLAGLLAVALTTQTGEEEQWLLSALADQAAVAIEAVRLEARERSLAGSVQRKDRALAIVSHDLRSPMHAILMSAELLAFEKAGPLTPKQQELLGRIRTGAKHVSALMSNVFEMAVLQSGLGKIRSLPVDLRAVIEQAVQIMRPEAEEKQQVFVLQAGSPVLGTADPDRLRQVLVNVIGNAIKYTPSGGRIAIQVSGERDGRWEIEVDDDGIGIDPQHLEAIFEPFFRAENERSPGEAGAGLGLAISREIMRAMSGDIRVQSQPGNGSRFILTLPVA